VSFARRREDIVTIASRNHRITLGVVLGGALMAVGFASCTDSYRDDLSSAGSAGAGGMSGGSTSGGGGDITTPPCTNKCANDLKTVVNCYGDIVGTCTPSSMYQTCKGSSCVDEDPCTVAQESRSSYGCDYWAIKTAQRAQADGSCFAAVVANAWSKPMKIAVSYDGALIDHKTTPFAYIPKAQGQTINYQSYDPDNGLPVGEVAILFLSQAANGTTKCPKFPALNNTETGVPRPPADVHAATGRAKAFHITTDYPAVAYQISPYGGGIASFTAATLLIPSSAWDTSYIAINAYKASTLGYPSLNVVAFKDKTDVTITPTAAIVGGTGIAGTAKDMPVTYALAAGEFLQISQQEELTGSTIKSSQPVGVFGAADCMNVPVDQSYCDSAEQQIAPLNALGSEYVAIRHKNRMVDKEETPPWRLVGAADGTMLTWEPAAPSGAPTTLKAGEMVEFNAAGPFVVKSDKDHPFYLGGYMTGGAAYNDIGDPEWVNVTAPAQYLSEYVFFTDPSYPETSLTVVRTPYGGPDQHFADVTLECQGVLTGWQKIGAFEYTRVDLVTGNFAGVKDCANGRQRMTSSLPFGVTVWGWGTVVGTTQVSYAYPAAAGFQKLNSVPPPK
jgi:hypothetical protein